MPDGPTLIGGAVIVASGLALVLLVSRRIGTEHKSDDAQPVTLADATAGLRLIVITPALLGAISLDLEPGATVIDIGSGTGDALAEMARQRPISGIGIEKLT